MTTGDRVRRGVIGDNDDDNTDQESDEQMSDAAEEDGEFEDIDEDDGDDGVDEEAADQQSQSASPGATQPEKSEVYLPGRQLADDEELVVDESAYIMFHQAQTGDPCLSFDVLQDRLGDNRSEYPLTMYLVAGTQSARANKNSVIVLKMSNLHRTKHSSGEDDDDQDDEDDDDEELPDLDTACLKHNGCVNRIRATTWQQQPLCATWSETGAVHVWHLARALQAVDEPHVGAAYVRNGEEARATPLFSFTGHAQQGYALDWSTVSPGTLATGDCARAIHVWRPGEGGNTWHVDQRPLLAHTDSVEDLQWSPNEPAVLASCSVDKSIRVWDVRASPSSSCMITVPAAHQTDVNVISWHRHQPLLASGGDDGSLSVWDLRSLQSGRAVATFKHHNDAVTSVEWQSSTSSGTASESESVLASAGADNQVVQWDLAVEPDQAGNNGDDGNEEDELNRLPPQLLFIHQGQTDIKELHWHAQIPGCLVSTALSGFNVFRTVSV